MLDLLWREMMTSKILSEFFSEDRSKKTVVGITVENQCHFVDFYEDDVFQGRSWLPDKNNIEAEKIAEDYVFGLVNLIVRVNDN